MGIVLLVGLYNTLNNFLLAAMHNVGPNMADFATFIRDCVISVTGKYDVTEKTQ